MEFVETKIGKQGIRKGIVASVFLEFLIYVVLIFYHVFKYPQSSTHLFIYILFADNASSSYKQSKQTSLDGDDSGNQQKSVQSDKQNTANLEPYSRQYLEERFRIFFLYHIVGVGFALLYAANSLEIILSYFHLISFFVIIVAKARDKQSIMHLCTFICYFIDIMLMISGTAGMNIK